MAVNDEWVRYPRTLPGAWSAIDDLRDTVREMKVERRVILNLRQRAFVWIVGAASVANLLFDFLGHRGHG